MWGTLNFALLRLGVLFNFHHFENLSSPKRFLIMIAEDEQVTLSDQQRERLHELERVVERNLTSFLEAGRALLEIRDSGFYKHYGTFEQYLVRRWGISTSRGKELMRSTLVAENLLTGAAAPGGDAPLPEGLSEQSLRPLSKLSPFCFL